MPGFFEAAQQRAAHQRQSRDTREAPRPRPQPAQQQQRQESLYGRLHEQAMAQSPTPPPTDPTAAQIRGTAAYQEQRRGADEWADRMGGQVSGQLVGAGLGRGGSAYRAATGVGEAHQALLGQALTAGQREWGQSQARQWEQKMAAQSQDWNRMVQGAGFSKGLSDTAFQQEFATWLETLNMQHTEKQHLMTLLFGLADRQQQAMAEYESEQGWRSAVDEVRNQANPYV